MKFSEIATQAEELRAEKETLAQTLVVRIATSRYPAIEQYDRILNDLIVLTRNLARNLETADGR